MPRTRKTLAQLRYDLEQACREAAEATPTGASIEHVNHRILEAGIALGRAMLADDKRSQRTLEEIRADAVQRLPYDTRPR